MFKTLSLTVLLLLILSTAASALTLKAKQLTVTGIELAEVCSESSCEFLTVDAAKALLKNMVNGDISSPKASVQSASSDTRTTQHRYETATEVVIVVTIEYLDANGNVIDVQNHTFRFLKKNDTVGDR